MESVNQGDCIGQIGDVSGQVWRALSEIESTSMSKLIRSIDAPRDTIMQAVGWLAREGKINIEEAKRGRTVSLVESERQWANSGGNSFHVDAA